MRASLARMLRSRSKRRGSSGERKTVTRRGWRMRNILAKLARILPEVEIVHAAHSRSGLFEVPGDRYGEVWYSLAGRKSMTRSTTEQIVLDNLYQLAQVPPPVRNETEFPGH